ncbi:unnamed protein product [Paramecium sonneborni]|uniref:Uncharacterized protein n=1 Tax=Paramecium sonneborni TaxID=65129 RepID=A0A8S1PPT0_9CILI|nr:unnamed protein product [Paramecium sonneborni]
MGSQIQKSNIKIVNHPSKKLQRPQAKAVFEEVRVNDPGAPINSSLIELDNCFIDDNVLGCQDQNKTINNSSNFEENKKTQDSNNFHIQPLKGILKKEPSISQSPSRYFNEEAKFVRFQLTPKYLSKHNSRVVKSVKSIRKSRITSLL